MALNIGIRYAMAGNAEGLAQWLHEKVGHGWITLELKDGPDIVGTLESFEPGRELVVDTGEQDSRIPQDDVDGFTLLDTEPPLDRSDEVGREL